MESNKKQTLLKANTALYKTIDGVTYFKLKSEFDGDYTKNCGLLGEEIDKNFYFLRGYDIESIYVDEDRNLVINRVDKDYEPIKVNIGEDLGKDTFNFDKETGIITITYPDGTTTQMEGFLVEGKDIRMATDSTIDGDGTIFSPLRIAGTNKTGTFAPADKFFDLTIGGDYLPMPEGKGKGYRIVTKEKIDNFGCLYPFEAVEMIQRALTESKSQWRIPTKSDWDELFNAMEINKESRTHESMTNQWLGEVAGSALKSVNLWKDYESTSRDSYSVKGEDRVGLTIYPLGIGPDRNEILNDENADIEGFTKLAGMWTNTKDESGNAYVKIFGYNSSKIDQDTYGNGARMSIRLVKDYNYGNYNEMEEILALPYPTELVYGICDDVPYVKIWTKINVYDTDVALGGVRSKEWDIVTDSERGIKVVYFINEWDGFEWHKKPMKEGDSVVILDYTTPAVNEYYMKFFNSKINKYEYIKLSAEKAENAIQNGFKFEKLDKLPLISDGAPDYVYIHISSEKADYHEWRLINEELVDTAVALKGEFKEELDKLDKNLAEEIQNREDSDKKLHEAIIAEGELRYKVDNELNTALKNESNIRKSADDSLEKAIKDESYVRKSADDSLEKAIREEAELRNKVDNELNTALKNESSIRKSADDSLEKAIREEGELRKSVDDQLLEAIKNEGVIRKNNDITPGEYTLHSNESMTVPTNGKDIPDVKITISNNFFDFGPILNNIEE